MQRAWWRQRRMCRFDRLRSWRGGVVSRHWCRRSLSASASRGSFWLSQTLLPTTVPTAVPMARFIIEATIDRFGSMPAMALNDLTGRVNINAMTVAMIASIIRQPTPTGAVDSALSTRVIRPAATVNLTMFNTRQ